ncbi:zinc-dependent alcohol dehydrogenase family protein [Oceanibacterium hippocampi]|uniref:Alcohol dehydrogenase n=1 Tax=Oceanibacterium hippocampi TaxID=745714 RepID=A0A1Y5RST9_9PROT|nr:NAD(P)-dependent alcohol dehydrogenase [Oceanibacterium hippocampi]SLN21863.1 Alcohol dehydrogenase [Oceanibacterium hippocampi]
MKAAILKSPGIDNLVVEDRPVPKPGPGEVLVRLRFATLNFRDLLVINGGYGSQQRQSDLVPLSDGAGEVEAVGAGVTGYKAGDRVVGHFFPAWQSGEPSEARFSVNLGGRMDGVACEYRLFRPDAIAHVPEHLSLAEAAALPCAGLTAWNAVIAQGETKPGDCVLVQGTGGVSLFGLQFAHAAGATVIATSSSDAKLERCRALGADHLINYVDVKDWGDRARALSSEGQGVDHVVEVGGAGTMKQSLRAVRVGGRISMIGVLAGNRHELNVPIIVMRSIRLQGVTVGSYEHFTAMLRAIAQSRIKPVLDRTFPLAEIRAAFDHLQSGGHFGKIVIEI